MVGLAQTNVCASSTFSPPGKAETVAKPCCQIVFDGDRFMHLNEIRLMSVRCSIAGSAGGISPPAAHRSVRKSLDLHGSSQSFSCHLAMTNRRGRQMLIPVSRLAIAFFELSHPLRSTLITSASSLLLDDPPPSRASVLSPFVVHTYKVFPWHHMKSSQVPYLSLNWSHATYTPDTAWPISRFPPC